MKGSRSRVRPAAARQKSPGSGANSLNLRSSLNGQAENYPAKNESYPFGGFKTVGDSVEFAEGPGEEILWV